MCKISFKYLLVVHAIKIMVVRVGLLFLPRDFRPKDTFALFRTHNVFKVYNQMWC